MTHAGLCCYPLKTPSTSSICMGSYRGEGIPCLLPILVLRFTLTQKAQDAFYSPLGDSPCSRECSATAGISRELPKTLPLFLFLFGLGPGFGPGAHPFLLSAAQNLRIRLLE